MFLPGLERNALRNPDDWRSIRKGRIGKRQAKSQPIVGIRSEAVVLGFVEFTLPHRHRNRPKNEDWDMRCKWVAERFDELQTEAKLIVDDYWHRLKQGRKGKRQADRGSFGLRIRPRDTGAFSVEWYEMGALGGTRKPIAKRHIAKGRGHRYPLEKMLRDEADWIVGLVGEVEDSLVEIRKRQALLVAIRDALAAYESEVTGKYGDG